MSDARLRELELAARHGDPSAEAAWLRERMRTGTINEARLGMAALCGHRPAEEAWGVSSLVVQPSGVCEAMRKVAMLERAETENHEWKPGLVLLALAISVASQRAHHASRRGSATLTRRLHEEREVVEAVIDPVVVSFSVPIGRARRVVGKSCSDPWCDLALRGQRAVRAWLESDDHRTRGLCFSLASMGAAAIAPWTTVELAEGHGPRIADLWVTSACAMACHSSGRPDLLPRLLESARRAGADDAALTTEIQKELVPWLLS